MRRLGNAVLVLALTCTGPLWAASGSLVGGLYVTTTPPGATVYVNGEVRGVSPCGVPDVGIGQVEVRAVKQGRAPATSTVEVRGDRTRQVHLDMAQLVRVGSLAVVVDPPGARIMLDRVPSGRTPRVILNVPAGTHRLEVSADGYRPFTATVTVAPNELHLVQKELLAADAPPSPPGTVADLPLGESLEWSRVPYPEDLPEERAFESVRRLVADRRYREALAELDGMPQDMKEQYAQRVARERSVIRRLRELVRTAHAVLATKVGEEDYRLSLGKGFPLTCTILDVGEGELKVMTAAGERTIELSELSAENIVRLAAERSKARDPDHATNAALLYGAEGQFEKAYEQLRLAADKGGDIATARSYVDGERLWAAALQKHALRRLRAQGKSGDTGQRLIAPGQPIRVVLDVHRGADAELAAQLGASPLFEVHRLEGPFDPDRMTPADVLMVVDPGPGKAVGPYGRQEVQQIMDAIHGGTGLVFFGTFRPPDRPQPFTPLLRWCGALVRPERLVMSDRAPDAYPEEYALAYPVSRRHPVTAGAGHVVFPMPSPSLQLRGSAGALLRASPHLGSRQAGEAAPPMAAAGIYGKGRYVVFANLPVINTSPHQGSPLYANAAARVIRNGILWAAGYQAD